VLSVRTIDAHLRNIYGKLGVAELRRVRAQPGDPLQPVAAVREHLLEVRRVRAVDHVVGHRPARLGVDLADRVAERLAARQPPVGLDRERDHDGDLGRGCGASDADRLLRVRHRDRRHHVGPGGGERADLRGVILLGVRGRHRVLDHVAVAARPDDAVDEHRWSGRPVLVADLLGELDRRAVDSVERLSVVAQPCAPVRVRAPRRGVEDEAGVALARDVEVAREVVAQRGPALAVLEQLVRGEQRQVEPAVEDHRRLEAAVGEEDAVARELRKRGEHERSTISPRNSFPQPTYLASTARYP
jgi:hypothetical protein